MLGHGGAEAGGEVFDDDEDFVAGGALGGRGDGTGFGEDAV